MSLKPITDDWLSRFYQRSNGRFAAFASYGFGYGDKTSRTIILDLKKRLVELKLGYVEVEGHWEASKLHQEQSDSELHSWEPWLFVPEISTDVAKQLLHDSTLFAAILGNETESGFTLQTNSQNDNKLFRFSSFDTANISQAFERLGMRNFQFFNRRRNWINVVIDERINRN